MKTIWIPIIFFTITCLINAQEYKNSLGLDLGYSYSPLVNTDIGDGFVMSATYDRKVSKRWQIGLRLSLSSVYGRYGKILKNPDTEYSTILTYIEYPNGLDWFVIDDQTFLEERNSGLHLNPSDSYKHHLAFNFTAGYEFLPKSKLFDLKSHLGIGGGVINNSTVLSSYSWTSFLDFDAELGLVWYQFERRVRYLYLSGLLGLDFRYNITEDKAIVLSSVFDFEALKLVRYTFGIVQAGNLYFTLGYRTYF